MSENVIRRHREVTDAELGVLEALWRQGAATIRELTDDLYPGGGTAHYATVQKLLERLGRKGCVARSQDGRAHVYRPLVERETLVAQQLQATADRLTGGSLTPLLTCLVGAAEAAELSAEDLAALRRLVARLEPEEE